MVRLLRWVASSQSLESLTGRPEAAGRGSPRGHTPRFIRVRGSEPGEGAFGGSVTVVGAALPCARSIVSCGRLPPHQCLSRTMGRRVGKAIPSLP
jgi:hypothetical protein